MSKDMNIDPQIKQYLSYVRKVCLKIFNADIYFSFDSVYFKDQIFIEVPIKVITNKKFFGKPDEKIFYVYFSSSGKIAVNSFLGSKKYIQSDFKLHTCYEEIYHLMLLQGQISHSTFRNRYIT